MLYTSKKTICISTTVESEVLHEVAQSISAVCADYFGERLYAELIAQSNQHSWLVRLKKQDGNVQHSGRCFIFLPVVFIYLDKP